MRVLKSLYLLAKTLGEFEFNAMHKKFFILILAFALCVSFGNPTPVERLCNVKIKNLEVVLTSETANIRAGLKNFSDKSFIVDLSCVVFEVSPSQKTIVEILKARSVEIGAGEEKSADVASLKIQGLFNPKGVYKASVILTYKPEVFIGFFNNDKIIDEHSAVFSLREESVKK